MSRHDMLIAAIVCYVIAAPLLIYAIGGGLLDILRGWENDGA